MEAADWASLSDEQLLERRISKLGLRLEGTAVEPLIKQLYEELSAKGVEFQGPPQTQSWGIATVFKDNSGNWFSLSQHPED